MFSRQCEYALQAVCYLALKKEGEMSSIKEMTKKLDVPYHFLAKILQDLSRKGLLRSLKGPTGGFALGLPAKNITLFHIVEAIDGVKFTSGCVMGFPECSGKNPCAIHEQWASLRDGIYQMLVHKHIVDVAKDMRKQVYAAVRR
jgi:Rrf2 family protein